MESLELAGDRSASPADVEVLIEQRVGPGIVMLTESLQLLHMDRRAWELGTLITRAENGKVAHGVLPPAVAELCVEIVRLMRERTEAKDWEQFQIRRTCGGTQHPVLLRGFGLPDRSDFKLSRVLVMMEEVARRKGPTTSEAKERFQLTEREDVVVQKLSRGLTNKEIANELGIAEQTVKEHIKHIMQKTRATTRTGVLVRVLH